MELPGPPRAVAALATFVRERLADVSDTIAPLWQVGQGVLGGRDRADVVTSVDPDSKALATARQFAAVVVGATAPFAPNPYARARLIRQLHATGLLTADEVYRVTVATATLDGPAAQPRIVDADVVGERRTG
ncbi:hypothetical protein SAMN05443575_2789 [Jatrophihabitans endophyticus]|uniref:Uncharacterized protein n=1 Tax=Jatrophihabitans endophyticus TaxID=1206085 RepID=A0A1M5MPX1_9ACTN|nr:hypothetical protein [Jatrophihabitans endophyticus]SHG79286.1 hypothetical protein SAMN05443575_2789 [Jatrophihabitans endophyticus]